MERGRGSRQKRLADGRELRQNPDTSRTGVRVSFRPPSWSLRLAWHRSILPHVPLDSANIFPEFLGFFDFERTHPRQTNHLGYKIVAPFPDGVGGSP